MVKKYVKLLESLFVISRQEVKANRGILPNFLILFFLMVWNVSLGQLFQQQFATALATTSSVQTTGTYFAASPTNAQFTGFTSSGAGSTITVGSNKLTLARTANAWGIVRGASFGAPTSLMIRFDYANSASSGASTSAVVFAVGGGTTASSNNTTLTNADLHTRLAFNCTANAGEFVVRDIAGSTNGATTFSGTQTVLFVINNSGATLNYKAPNGSEESVANDKFDVWVGTSKQLDEKSATTATQALNFFKCINSSGVNTVNFSNMLMDPIPATTTTTAATLVNGNGFTANWTTVAGVTGYRLDVATDAAFTSMVSGFNDLYVSGQATSSKLVTGLSGGTSYWYRVRAVSQYTVGEFASGNSNAQNPSTTGSSPVLAISIPGTPSTFSSVCTNSGTSSVTYRITNSGPVAAAGVQVAISGTNSTDFSISGFTQNSTIAASGTADYTITFDPSASGSRTATATVTSTTSGSNTPTSSLSGTGIASVTQTATTNSPTTFAGTTATLSGSYGLGVCPSSTTRGFVYSKTSDDADPLQGGTFVTTTSTSASAGTFTLPVTGLSYGTQYSYKAYIYDGTTYTYGSIVQFTTTPAPPVNDACATATVLSIGTTNSGGTFASATPDYGTSRDVWYSFTPSCSGTHTIAINFPGDNSENIDFEVYASTCPSSTAGRLTLFGGDGPGNVPIANSTNGGDETADFNTAVSGNTYYIRVIDVSDAATTFDITVSTSVTPEIVLANTGTPAASNIASGTNNAVLYGFTLTPSSCSASYTFSAASIATSGTATTSDLSNFRLIVDSSNFGVADAGEISAAIGSASFTNGNPLSFTSLVQTLTGGSAKRYLLIADVNSGATNARTFTASLANTDITASQTITGSAAGNQQTITATSVTIADNGTQVAAGNILRGTNTTVISKAKFTVSGGTASITQIDFVTAGSAGAYVSSDITTNGFRLWRTSSSTFDTNTPIASFSSSKATATSNETISFTTSESLSVGDYYYWLTVDVSNTAISSRTITINGLTNTSITSVGNSITGTTSASGAQTIVAPNLSAGTIAAFGTACINSTSSANSFTLSGSTLDGSTITIGPLSGFVFDAGSGYGATATISGYGSTIATTINVKFAPTLVQSYGGTGSNGIPVSGGNAPTVYVDASGTGINVTAVVTSSAATSLNNTIATLNGNVGTLAICPAATTQKGFVYSVTATNSDPINGGTGVTTSSVSGLTTGNYLLNLTGLTPATGYTFKAYLFDGTTYTYGAATTFSTLTPADHLTFVGVPSTGSTGTNLTSFTVEARRPNGSVDDTYTSNIVLTKATGSGTLSGTTTKAAVAGVATFNDIQLSAAGSYTLFADSGILPQVTSSAIAIAQTASATWLLTANANATTVGNVSGGTQTGGTGIGTMSYTTNGVSSNSWGTAGLDANDYYQFTISPTSGNDLVVSSIATTNNLSSTTATGEVYYSFSPSFTSPVSAGASFAIGTGAVTTTFSGLSISVPNTQTLYVRVFIYKGSGNTLGSGQTVRCKNVTITGSTTATIFAPTVTTTTASAITTSGATSGGNVTSDGGASVSARGVAYGTSTAPTTGTSDGIGTGTFASTLSGLSINTKYFYRAYATNTIGTNYGSESNFYTLANVPGLPVVNNANYTSLDISLDGSSTNSNPSITEFAIQETSTSNYVQANGTLGASPVWKTAATWATITVSPLASSTTYTFRLKARNGDNVETAFGTGLGGTTLTPIVATLSAGTLNPFGSVCINTTTAANSFTLSGTTLDGSTVTIGPLAGFTFDAGSGYGATATISGYGTTISTTINVKFTPTAVQSYGGTGINGIPVSGGNATTVYVDASGTGINTPPTVTSGNPSGITSVAAILAGNITVAGCSAISSYGIEYSTSAGFSNGAGTQVTGTGYTTGPFTASVSGLTPNTTYYYHAYVVNGFGSFYSAEASFLTSGLAAPVANAASSVTSNSFVANWTAVTGASSYRLDVSTSSTFSVITNATDLFISEYVEGSSNNKYIEIYNGTGTSVNLSDYRLRSYTNGATTPGNDVLLSGTLANGSTIVYKNASATVYAGASTSNGALNYNGNDAVALFKISTNANVDIFGRIGEDPGAGGWTATGGFATTDKTLVRKATVIGGVTTNPSSGFPTLATEWTVSNIDVVTNLGSHTFTNPVVPSFVSGYNDLTVNATSQAVTGLTPSTTYYYRARAFAATSTSANSNVINVTTLANPSVTISGAASRCSTDSAVTWTAIPGTGGVAPYSYSWDTVPVQTGATASITNAGTYTVTITDSNNVTATASKTFTVNTAANAGSNGSITLCSTSSAVNLFSSLGGTPDASGTWSGPSTLSGGNLGTFTPGTSIAGTYTYTVAGTAPCANATATVVVTVQSAPASAGTNGTLSVCAGTTPSNAQLFAALGGSPAAGGTWSNVGLVYTYTQTAISPCAVNNTATVTVTEQALPASAGSNGTLTICSTTTLTTGLLFGALTGSPATGGTWSPAPSGAGTYTYTQSATSPCTVDNTATVVVSVVSALTWYQDLDGDGYGNSAVSQVTCSNLAPAYSLLGGDCNDAVATINPGVTEICYNNIDDNCSGAMSEGCAPVVVNMTASYNNTTLLSLSTAIPAVGYTYPGTSNIKYRFSITNVTTNVTSSDIIQASRYVTIPASLHVYGATYTIKVSAVINDEVVPFYGNTITVTGPTVQLITLSSASCGATLASLSSTISANGGLNATGYTFRIRLTSDSGPTPTYGFSSSATRFVGANTFAGFPLQYNTSYQVAVKYTYNDPVTSLPVEAPYGAECTVSTPSIPLIGLAAPTCGSQVATMNAGITASPAAYATGYRFRIRLTSDNGPTPTYYYSLPNASRFSSLVAFQGITLAYNTQYSIAVEYSILNNSVTQWSGFGSECIVQTPFFPTTSLVPSQCGLSTATSLTQQLNITPYPGFPNYKVKLDEISGESITNSQEIVITYSNFRLNQFSIAQLGKNYNVSVAIKQNGVFGDYSTACDLFTAAPSRTVKLPFKASAYPNPFANNFMLDVTTSSKSVVGVKVYDMVGRLIEQREVNVSDMENTTIGDRYPSGVYNVVVSQEDSVEIVRVVKR
ncbi:lamin tail domain-containing protein [Flavobacterium sp. N1994]|uniref:lamin tail domain-containing protein n=1 Tax=Flavobacterium sp. N1994 TaxID=2986827 RepID=UPI0022234777|nr:lamin tail domain-containing protein [Flavobacterium sp. N1994]